MKEYKRRMKLNQTTINYIGRHNIKIDDIVKGILPYVNQENGKLVIIITCEGYEGYVINELTCLYG